MTLPVLEATIGLLRKNGKTLFIDYRNYPHPLHKGFFAFPGGKINLGETKEEGVIRELKEETNIVLQDLIYRGKVLFDNSNRLFGGKPSKYSFLVYYFDSYKFDDSNQKASEGEIVYASDEEAELLPIHKGDKQIWDWLKIYKEIDARVKQDEQGNINATLISFVK